MMIMIMIAMTLVSIYRLHFQFCQTCSVVGISLEPSLSALVPVAGAGLHIGGRLEAWRRTRRRDEERWRGKVGLIVCVMKGV